MNSSDICYLISAAEGGIRKHVFDVLDESFEAERRCKLIIYAENQIDAQFDYEKKARNSQIQFIGLQISKKPNLTDLLNIFKVLHEIRKLGIDIIHAHGAKAGLYSRLIKLIKPSISVIYSPHGGSMHQINQKGIGKLALIVEKLLVKKTDLFVFESEYARSLFSVQVSADKKRTIVIPNRVKINAVAANPEIYRYIEGARNLGKRTVAVVGRIRHIKGHDLIIRALQHINFPVQLVFVGQIDPQFLDELEKIEGFDQVKIWGDESDVVSFYKYADLIVCPSRAESFGYVPCEAILSGAKVVLSRIPAFEETLGIEKNAYFFESENEISLARAIEHSCDRSADEVGEDVAIRLSSDNFGEKFNRVYTNFLA